MTNNVSTLAAKPHDFVLRRAHLVIAGAVVITLVVAVFLYRQRAIEVELVAPRYEDIESTVSAKGNVFPTDDFAARATFSGVVDDIYVHLGEKVHRGQKLVQLRDQFAESRVNNARAALLSADLSSHPARHDTDSCGRDSPAIAPTPSWCLPSSLISAAPCTGVR